MNAGGNLMRALLKVLTISTCVMAQVRVLSTTGTEMPHKTHFKCRGFMYGNTTEPRFFVPDNKVSWKEKFTDYDPHSYTSPTILGKPWADPEIGSPGFEPVWNDIDKFVDRRTYECEKYEIVDGYPRNVRGRTGVVGRGVLGRWGPNHAADPVVTRWKRDSNKHIIYVADRPILQVVVIKRRDTGEWALPGGMIDIGETVSAAAIREFYEEAMNSLRMSKDEKLRWQEKFDTFFHSGELIMRGYVDDPRNTDNAWMETTVYNFHDEDGSVVGRLRLHAGDDAVGVRWVDAVPEVLGSLYASHGDIVQRVRLMRIENFFMSPPN